MCPQLSLDLGSSGKATQLGLCLQGWDKASSEQREQLSGLGWAFRQAPQLVRRGRPIPVPECPPCTKHHKPGCSSTQMDAPGQQGPTINALNAPRACRWLVSNWAAAACILVSDHSDRALRLPTPSRQGRLELSSTAPSLSCLWPRVPAPQPFNLHPWL